MRWYLHAGECPHVRITMRDEIFGDWVLFILSQESQRKKGGEL